MSHSTTMKELPVSERPYEKCEEFGPSVLSDAELLAVMIRTGSGGACSTELARQVLMRIPGRNIAGLFQMSLEELQEIRGIGRVKAIQLQCLTEITKRMMQSSLPVTGMVCAEPEDVAAAFMPQMRFVETEQVRLLILDNRNAVSREVVISEGSFNASLAAPREIFYNALKYKAVSILLLHNHPSGDPTPSREDITLTRRLADTGRLIGIPLIDHIILGDNRYESLQENGYLE